MAYSVPGCNPATVTVPSLPVVNGEPEMGLVQAESV